MKKRATHTSNLQSGITLIELIVVVGIVAVVSVVILFNYSGFSTNVSLKNLAQEIALSARKAQSYATSVQSLPNGQDSQYAAYGIAFSLAAPVSNEAIPSTKRFVIFADINGDGVYEPGTSCGNPSSTNGECLEGFGITNGDTVVQLCNTDSDNVTTCTSDSGTTVEALFCRPAPDAGIYFNGTNVPECATGSPASSAASVIVQSAQNFMQTIKIWTTGQISVQ